MIKLISKTETRRELPASVHCYMCSHNVTANVLASRKQAVVKPGQKCPRCSSALDSAFVLRVNQAA